MLGNRPKKFPKMSPGRQLHGRAVAPVHDPLEGVEVPEHGLGIFGPVRPVLLVVGAAQVHGQAQLGFVDDRPEAVEDRVGQGASPEGVGSSAVGVTRLDLNQGGPVGHHLLQLGHGQLGIGQGDVGRQEHAPLGDITHLLVHPAVEGPDVGIEGRDVVGELVLDVVGRRGKHERLVDALVVHQGQAQVTVAERLGLVAELRDELLPLLVVQPPERVEPGRGACRGWRGCRLRRRRPSRRLCRTRESPSDPYRYWRCHPRGLLSSSSEKVT